MPNGAKQGEHRVAKDNDSAVDRWVAKGFIGFVGLSATILVLFFAWIASNINEIASNTSSLQSESANTKLLVSEMVGQMTGLKVTLDDLRFKSKGWATKDSLYTMRDSALNEISAVRGDLVELNLRVTRMEAEMASQSREEKPSKTR